jgi:hypothetical protein
MRRQGGGGHGRRSAGLGRPVPGPPAQCGVASFAAEDTESRKGRRGHQPGTAQRVLMETGFCIRFCLWAPQHPFLNSASYACSGDQGPLTVRICSREMIGLCLSVAPFSRIYTTETKPNQTTSSQELVFESWRHGSSGRVPA